MVYIVKVPHGVEAVEINRITWNVEPGATHLRITISTSDDGIMRTSARPVWEGDTTE